MLTICKFYEQDLCRFRNKCKFIHSKYRVKPTLSYKVKMEIIVKILEIIYYLSF